MGEVLKFLIKMIAVAGLIILAFMLSGAFR